MEAGQASSCESDTPPNGQAVLFCCFTKVGTFILKRASAFRVICSAGALLSVNDGGVWAGVFHVFFCKLIAAGQG